LEQRTIDFKLKLVCSSQESFDALQVLKNSKIEHKVVEPPLALAPSAEMVYTILLWFGDILATEAITKIFKQFGAKRIFIDYESRFEAATMYLEKMKPLICESRDDRREFSEYVFKTRISRYKWTYDRGEVILRKEK
jgi:hypothetical protein